MTAVLAYVSAGLAILIQLMQIGASAADVIEAAKALHDKVQAMIEANREPTQEEWDWVNGLIKANTAKLEADPAAQAVS